MFLTLWCFPLNLGTSSCVVNLVEINVRSTLKAGFIFESRLLDNVLATKFIWAWSKRCNFSGNCFLIRDWGKKLVIFSPGFLQQTFAPHMNPDHVGLCYGYCYSTSKVCGNFTSLPISREIPIEYSEGYHFYGTVLIFVSVLSFM